jgi:hypothetical protein
MSGFTAQYLNVWQLGAVSNTRGQALVTEEDWGSLQTVRPDTAPDAAAVESWFGDGVTLALAWKVGDQVVLSTSDYADAAHAADALKSSGFTRVPTIGASLLETPEFRGTRARKGQGRTGDAVRGMAHLLSEGSVLHDGSDALTAQATNLRTLPGADGPRVSSNGRADAVKAAVWAAADCRRRRVGSLSLIT